MSDQESSTHPGRAARLEAVTGGWHEGSGPAVGGGTDPDATLVAGAADAIDAVTRLFQAIASGSPAPFAMTGEMKNAYNSQLGQAQMMIGSKGALQDVSIINQTPAQGGTIYYFVATFASGTLQGQVGLLEVGTIGAFYFQ